MKLRYFLDWGGDILWAGDDEASDKYGYPVNMELLSISQESRKLIERLFILWLSLAQGSKSTKERENFNKLNEIVFKNLTRELQFAEIINEMPNISSQPTAYQAAEILPSVRTCSAAVAAFFRILKVNPSKSPAFSRKARFFYPFCLHICPCRRICPRLRNRVRL